MISPGEITALLFCGAKKLRSPRVRHAPKHRGFSEIADYLTSLNKMPRNAKPGTTRIDLDISVGAKLRFATIHDALGFKTKTETFEAIVYAISTEGKIDPHTLERIERKLDRLTEHLEDFA